MSGARRRSFETGHRPKFLVVIDPTPECGKALRFAARRAARTGAVLTLLALTTPPDEFEWLGIEEAMLAEAEEEAAQLLAAASASARAAAGLEPETVIRVGEKAAEVQALIHEDPDISFLVLAAGAGKDEPGPLVSTLVSKLASTFPIPIVIVPGSLSDEEIDALAG